MITAVDTNVLLDILIPNQIYLESSLKKIENASGKGKIIICEIVFTELASQFPDIGELNNFLNVTHIELIWNNKESLFDASRLWIKYIQKNHKKKSCSECGRTIDPACPLCESKLNFPRRMLNDFIIGSHANIFADAFITRDRGFYRSYFSGIKII